MAEIIYGNHPVLEALRANPDKIERIFYSRVVHDIFKLAKKNKIPLIKVPQIKLQKITGTSHHQGIAAKTTGISYAKLEDIFTRSKNSKQKPLILIPENIQDPQNLGSLIRTSEALGVHGIVISKRKSVGITPGVIKASAGAVAHLPIVRVANLVYLLSQLKKKGLWIIGAEAHAPQKCFELDFNMPLALVLGGEDQGLSRLIKENCDFLIKIPLKGKVSSLNVGVAGGILLYEILKHRTVSLDTPAPGSV